MKTILFSTVLLLLLSGCTDDGELPRYIKEPSKCINGFKYFSYYKGASLYLNSNGKPVRCSMIKKEN